MRQGRLNAISTCVTLKIFHDFPNLKLAFRQPKKGSLKKFQ